VVEVRGLRLSTTEEPGAKTIKGTKFEILLPALLPLVGPGAITPMEKVPAFARNEAGIEACTSALLTTLEARFMLALPLLFQVTLDPATKPEPVTVNNISCCVPALAPLGVIDVIEELTVGEAPR
jgi:hypothetical protein